MRKYTQNSIEPDRGAAWKRRHLRPAAAAIALALCATSCLGLDARATIDSDGSGTISLVYSVPRMIAYFDKLEGVDRVLPLPLTKDGAEKAVAVTPGISLAFFERSETETEIAIRMELGFSTIAGLAVFFDPTGERTAYIEENDTKKLRMVLTQGRTDFNPELSSLIDAAFAPYRIDVSITAPARIMEAGIGKATGSTVAWSMETPELLKRAEALTWEIAW